VTTVATPPPRGWVGGRYELRAFGMSKRIEWTTLRRLCPNQQVE
jgi:hypothetical protein